MAEPLNDRQRQYLLAALEVDQHQERWHKLAFGRGDFDESRRPASDWRALPFGVLHGLGGPIPTMLRTECQGADEGSGSTWSALARRGLLTVQHRPTYRHPDQPLPHITLTAAGRKHARELKGEKPAPKPKGALSRATWKALAAGYRAGDQGLWDERGGSWYGGVSWDMWLLLLRFRGSRPRWFEEVSRLLTEEERRSALVLGHRLHGVQITEEGRWKYEQAWAVNHQLHPDIEAPNPNASVPSAKGGNAAESV
ncbi:hypothetical protein GO986_12005 [Deinococcus sp. HMF7620]|uniref:Uncharacterized protein n=1 Tax=Deinococcus arboris TaxID=2682977 RepID=A0A7C9HZ46_9DEIO|nr:MULTISPECIES: hypothetical protein [Deinococcus]MBZ9752160.1 hypothetical protein [Deinococcus betulae]MVN87488.1 hypothetical protein [Deinococcus arboris]